MRVLGERTQDSAPALPVKKRCRCVQIALSLSFIWTLQSLIHMDKGNGKDLLHLTALQPPPVRHI